MTRCSVRKFASKKIAAVFSLLDSSMILLRLFEYSLQFSRAVPFLLNYFGYFILNFFFPCGIKFSGKKILGNWFFGKTIFGSESFGKMYGNLKNFQLQRKPYLLLSLRTRITPTTLMTMSNNDSCLYFRRLYQVNDSLCILFQTYSSKVCSHMTLHINRGFQFAAHPQKWDPVWGSFAR